MSELHQIGRVANTANGGDVPDVGEPPGGANYAGLHVVSTQLDDVNLSLQKIIEQNNFMLIHLSLITGLSNNE